MDDVYSSGSATGVCDAAARIPSTNLNMFTDCGFLGLAPTYALGATLCGGIVITYRSSP